MPTTTPSQDRPRAWTPVDGVPVPRAASSGRGPVDVAAAPGAPAVPRQQGVSGDAVTVGSATQRTVPTPAVPAWAVPTRLAPGRPTPGQPAPDLRSGTGTASPAPRPRRTGALDGLGAVVTLGAVAVAGTAVVLGVLLTSATGPVPTAPAVPMSTSPNVSVPGRVLTAVDDGVWQVGVDVEPGTYASTGPVAGATCRHALRRARTGGNVTASTAVTGAALVVLTEDDGWFETSGCATWTRVG